MTKAEKIAEMLNWIEVARETLNGPSSIPGDGESAGIMPPMWNGSYRELERCLQRMRESRGSLILCRDGVKRSPRALWWHVTERYLRSELRRGLVAVKYDRSGKPMPPAHSAFWPKPPNVPSGEKRVLASLRVWSHEVVEAAVLDGIDWLAEAFRGEPYLPWCEECGDLLKRGHKCDRRKAA